MFPPGHLVNACVAHIAITVPPTEFGVLQRVRCWGHWVYGCDGMGAHIRPAARAQALLSVSGPRAVYGANGLKSSWPVLGAPGCGPLPPTFLLALADYMQHPGAPPAAVGL